MRFSGFLKDLYFRGITVGKNRFFIYDKNNCLYSIQPMEAKNR